MRLLTAGLSVRSPLQALLLRDWGLVPAGCIEALLHVSMIGGSVLQGEESLFLRPAFAFCSFLTSEGPDFFQSSTSKFLFTEPKPRLALPAMLLVTEQISKADLPRPSSILLKHVF